MHGWPGNLRVGRVKGSLPENAVGAAGRLDQWQAIPTKVSQLALRFRLSELHALGEVMIISHKNKKLFYCIRACFKQKYMCAAYLIIPTNPKRKRKKNKVGTQAVAVELYCKP